MKYYFLLGATALLISSCKKDKGENETPTNPTDCKLKTITYDFSPAPRTYDVLYSNNNIIELSSTIDKTVYSYNSIGKLIKKETYDIGNPQVQVKSEFTYNSNGLPAVKQNYEYYNSSLQATSKYTFEYNGTKRTQVNSFAANSTTLEGKLVYTWTGDNITTVAYYDENNQLESTINFEYDLSKENSFYTKFKNFELIDLYDEDHTPIYFMSKNQLTKSIQGNPTESDNWTYSYNNNGLTKSVNINGAMMWQFTYTCD